MTDFLPIRERSIKRLVFVHNNIKQLLQFEKDRKKRRYFAFTAKNPRVKIVSSNARNYIGYSDKTADCDICWSLFRLAMQLHKENIKYQVKKSLI